MYVRDILTSKLEHYSSSHSTVSGSPNMDWLPDSLRAACQSLKIGAKEWVIGVNSQAALYWLNMQKNQWSKTDLTGGKSLKFIRIY